MAPPAPKDAHTLKRDIQQLATAAQALDIQHEDYLNVQQPEESDNEEYNPFAEEQEDLRWEQGFKFELPEFHGGQSAEELLEWIFTVEETLDFKRVPLEQRVPMSVMRFRGRAATWWLQLNASRARLGKPRILSWDKLKKNMRKTFLPFNYDQEMFLRLHTLQQGEDSVEEYSTQFFSLLTRVDLQDSDQQIVARFIGGLRKNIREQLNLLNPLTVAEAHQRALTLEAQTKNDFWPNIAALCIIVACAGASLTCLLSKSSKRRQQQRQQRQQRKQQRQQQRRQQQQQQQQQDVFRIQDFFMTSIYSFPVTIVDRIRESHLRAFMATMRRRKNSSRRYLP